MMTIRSDDGSVIETVLRENGQDPMVESLKLSAVAGDCERWECLLTILDNQAGRSQRRYRVVRLELDLEVEE